MKNTWNEAGMYMKTKQHGISALSLGERVSRGGAFTGRRVTGEGFLGSTKRGTNHALYARTEGTNPECI